MRFHLRRRKFSLEIDLIAFLFGHGLTIHLPSAGLYSMIIFNAAREHMCASNVESSRGTLTGAVIME